MATETTVPTAHRRLLEWVDEAIALCKPDDVHWCDGIGGGVRPAVPAAGRRRHVPQALRGQAPQLLPGALGSGRRGARRGPHVHLLGVRGGRRTDQQLARTGRDAGAAARQVLRRHARPHALRRAVLDGPARLPDLRDRRPADRFPLRRRVDADHDPHGPGRARRARRRRRVRALHAHGRQPARGGGDELARGRATPRSTSSTSPRRARSGPSAPATAATRCWGRSASRCGSPRSSPATRAGWPSTC